MIRQIILAVVIAVLAVSAATSDDLYKVRITGSDDARRLAGSGVSPVVRLDDGYLVLATADNAGAMAESGLNFELVARNVSRDRLATDNRLDRVNVEKYPLIFEQGNLRLYSLGQPAAFYRGTEEELVPVEDSPIPIWFRESQVTPEMLLSRLDAEDVPLEVLIQGISQDSLFALEDRLQAFYRRVAGTDSNWASRNWIASKLTSYGYDSVVIDSFVATISGAPRQCQNVLAYKMGTVYPNHHLIICAHRDAVSGSPGADDNGSGTVAVMEIARALKDVPTDVSIVFALFDAEEYGLLGAYHYLDEALVRGDSIVYVLNMDMIAHIDNTDYANVFHGAITEYSSLWITLADSLVGIFGSLAGASGGSDHYPFTQVGIDASFIAESAFSTVYHTSRDSTTYMNFPYMTRMVKACLGTAYAVSQSYSPALLALSYPSPVPEMLEPQAETPVDILIEPAFGGVLVPGSATLHYQIGTGPWQTLPMSEVAAQTYRANLPALECFEVVRFYASAEEAVNGEFYAPAAEDAYERVAAVSSAVGFTDHGNSSTGWTVAGDAVDGQWSVGTPVGLGERGDPATAFGGSGSCWLTDNVYGNSDVDNGTTRLTSPMFAGDSTARLSYAAWYSNSFGSNPHSQVFRVLLSNNNGSTWVQVDSLGPVFRADGGWYVYSIWLREVLTPTATMRIRFEASDIGAGAVVEAAIDELIVTSFACPPPTCCVGTVGNVDCSAGDGVDVGDVTALIDNLFINFTPLCCEDEANCDATGGIDVGDVTALIDNLFINFTPLPICQ